MKSIQITALILWIFIFILASFVLGQILMKKDIFDVTSFIIFDKEDKVNEDNPVDEQLADDIVIDKIGQETVRLGLNIGIDYFANYYDDYINYIVLNSDSYTKGEKISITETLASDYVFFAVSNNIDNDKYQSQQEEKIIISESEINSFIDKMFGKEIGETYKNDEKYGYSKINRTYSIDKVDVYAKCVQELEKIENITSNEIVLTYKCKVDNEELSKEMTINLTALYKGGRYIVTEVLKEE